MAPKMFLNICTWLILEKSPVKRNPIAFNTSNKVHAMMNPGGRVLILNVFNKYIPDIKIIKRIIACETTEPEG